MTEASLKKNLSLTLFAIRNGTVNLSAVLPVSAGSGPSIILSMLSGLPGALLISQRNIITTPK